MKLEPEEVTIVRRETTTKAVAGQVGINLLSLALGGGLGFHGFGKESLRGEKIEDVVNRSNLMNPVPKDFVVALQSDVDEWMAQDTRWRERRYAHPVVVGGGGARLLYEHLTGGDEALYRLQLDLDVYKKRESSAFRAARVVHCGGKSDAPKALSDWAESDYQMVRVVLEQMLADCRKRVVARLPEFLED